MSEQLRFPGLDAAGEVVSQGKRIVYFLDAGEFVKIGFTGREVDTRVGELQTGNPQPLKIIGSIMVGDGVDDETFHKRFAMYHHRGEFFKKTPALLSAIHDLIAKSQPDKLPIVYLDISADMIGDKKTWVFSFDCPHCKRTTCVAIIVPIDWVPETRPRLVKNLGCGHIYRIQLRGEETAKVR